MDVSFFFPELEGVPSEPASASTLLTLRYLHMQIDEFQAVVTKIIYNLSNLLTSSSSSDRSSKISSPTSNPSISTPVLSLWVRHWPRSRRREFYSNLRHPIKHIIFSTGSL